MIFLHHLRFAVSKRKSVGKKPCRQTIRYYKRGQKFSFEHSQSVKNNFALITQIFESKLTITFYVFCLYGLIITLLLYFNLTLWSLFFRRTVVSKYYAIVSGGALSCVFFFCTLMLIRICVSAQSVDTSFENALSQFWIVNFSLMFSFSFLSCSFGVLVTLIGFCTNFYILNYFKHEADEFGFIFWINGFISSMLILVFANNFFTLFLGWELIGLTSFFLINFWQAKRATLKASFKAFSFNLLSDIALLGAFINFYTSTGTAQCDNFLYIVCWDFTTLDANIKVGATLLILCAGIKSVQVFGHLWLPDSMEAPVPASALIHSATLVSAGIFLLCKFNILFVLLNWEHGVGILGGVTAAVGGITAAAQSDMKKLLAYSTMSHCGFLWVLTSLNNIVVVILYLFLHGIFKAATFYCAGSFIRTYGSQDTRQMGWGGRVLVGDSFFLYFCALNLAGLPFSIGAMYKAFFLKAFFVATTSSAVVGFTFLGMLASLVYFFRLVFFSVNDFLKSSRLLINFTSTKNKTKLANVSSIQNTHLLGVSILLASAVIVVYGFYWMLNITVMRIEDVTCLTPGFLLFKLKIEYLYSTYLIFFYLLYYFIYVSLVLIAFRGNSFLRELTVAIILFLVILGLACEVTLWRKLIH